jgi:transcriptional regulator with XRE-family HTH domain
MTQNTQAMGRAYTTFGEWVKTRRKERGLTQKALGLHVGYAEVTVRQVEKDSYKLTRFVVERFTNFLAIEIDDNPLQHSPCHSSKQFSVRNTLYWSPNRTKTN